MCLVCAFGVLGIFRTGYAVEMEPNSPGYLTDSHGATGVLRAFLQVADSYPEVQPYVEGTVNWLYSVRIKENGSCTWWMSMSAPTGHASARIRTPLGAIQVFAEVDKRWPNPKCREMIDESIVWLKKNTKKVQTASGEGWGALGSPNGQLRGNGSGRSGPGGLLMALAESFMLTQRTELKEMAIGMANLIKDAAIESKEDGRTLALWYFKEADKRWQTGWCYGTAGTSWGLFSAYEAIPEYRFHDNTSFLDLGNAGLNWLMTKAEETDGKITWPRLRAPWPSENTGWGSGAGGVGGTFLRGYEINKDVHPDLAARYLDIAKKTGKAIADQLNGGWDYLGKSHVVQNGVTREGLNLGFCGGIGGTSWFLSGLIRVVEKDNPKLAAECRDACKKLGQWYLSRAISFGGGRAWTARDKFGGEKTLSIALDYGLTGMIWSINILAETLDDKDLKKLEKDALTALLSLGVQEDTYKWPLFTKVGSE